MANFTEWDIHIVLFRSEFLLYAHRFLCPTWVLVLEFYSPPLCPSPQSFIYFRVEEQQGIFSARLERKLHICIYLKGPWFALLMVHICILCLYCDMSQKALYLSHTACAAAPHFTLRLKPEPSLLWLVSWTALLWFWDVQPLSLSRTMCWSASQ